MRILDIACAMVLISGCAVKKENPVDTLAADTMNVEMAKVATGSGELIGSPVPGRPAPAQTQNPPTTTPPKSSTPSTSTPDMVVTEYGIGPIRSGMTVAEAAKAMGGGFAAPRGGSSGCGYAVMPKAPPGLAVMIEKGKVARVEVRRGTIPTSAGAKIGDTEARINSLYAGRVTITPHKYTPDGHYLTVTPTDKSPHRIVFETDGKVVTEYRSGSLPAVEYVERCG